MKKRIWVRSQRSKLIEQLRNVDGGLADLVNFGQAPIGTWLRESMDPETGLEYDVVFLNGQVLLRHLEEFSNYFSRLAMLEATSAASPARQA